MLRVLLHLTFYCSGCCNIFFCCTRDKCIGLSIADLWTTMCDGSCNLYFLIPKYQFQHQKNELKPHTLMHSLSVVIPEHVKDVDIDG